MQILIASDHAGFALKTALIEHLELAGHEVEDMGAYEYDETDDYPDLVLPLAREVAGGDALGIVLGGSGQGEAMAANRISGVRAAVYYGGALDVVTLSREHNDANILSLGARFLTEEEAKEAVDVWLSTSFSDADRHARRIEKLDQE